jgi:hypothetical protein
MRDLPCPILPSVGRGHEHRGIRTWHHHGTSTALHHKLALAGALASFTCIIAAGALAIWQAAATPWSTTPILDVPEPSSVAIFGVAVAILAGGWSNRRAKP